MRGAWVLMACELAAVQARAEGVDSGTKATSSDAGHHGATTLLPMGKGLTSLGGSSLRYLAPGSRRWETLHRQAGDDLYRVGVDDSGRLLAAWEKDPFVHYFEPAAKRHTQLP